MNKITNEQLDGLIKSAVNSSGPLPPDEKFSQIISALRELRELRNAMLHGADGNSPVIPDGWVACSERMPEDEQEVITHNIFGYRHVSFFDEHSGNFFDRLDGSPVDCVEHVQVSHWMPLPAAPQQEVKP